MDLYGRHGHNHLHDHHHHLHHAANDAVGAAGAGSDDADEADNGGYADAVDADDANDADAAVTDTDDDDEIDVDADTDGVDANVAVVKLTTKPFYQVGSTYIWLIFQMLGPQKYLLHALQIFESSYHLLSCTAEKPEQVHVCRARGILQI